MSFCGIDHLLYTKTKPNQNNPREPVPRMTSFLVGAGGRGGPRPAHNEGLGSGYHEGKERRERGERRGMGRECAHWARSSGEEPGPLDPMRGVLPGLQHRVLAVACAPALGKFHFSLPLVLQVQLLPCGFSAPACLLCLQPQLTLWGNGLVWGGTLMVR